MSVCDPKFRHSPKMPDFTFWPFDVPSIMERIESLGLEVNTKNTIRGLEGQIEDLTVRLHSTEWRIRAALAQRQGEQK